jgi:hypothetical protein
MARPSLSAFTLKQRPTKLMTMGLLKIGCHRISTWDVGSVFAKHFLTFSQDPRMFFKNEKVVLWNLGASNSQLMFLFLGPFQWTES